jgi:hypothetical protein
LSQLTITGTSLEPICLRKSRHRQCRSWPLQRFPRILSDERNRMRTIETTQATIAHPSAPTIIFLSRAKLRSAPTEDQGGFTRYARFTSSDATDGRAYRDYLLHDSMESSTLRMMLGVYRRGSGSLTRLYTVSKLMNQR